MVIVTVLLAALLVATAVRKLSHRRPVVESYLRVGVPENRLNLLAAILLAGAAGLLAGLAWAPIGLAAAAGLVVYFLVAIAFHVRYKDLRHAGTPLVFWALSVLVLIFHVLDR